MTRANIKPGSVRARIRSRETVCVWWWREGREGGGYEKGASSGFMQISLVNSRRRGALYRFTQSRFVFISLAPPRAVLRVRP